MASSFLFSMWFGMSDDAPVVRTERRCPRRVRATRPVRRAAMRLPCRRAFVVARSLAWTAARSGWRRARRVAPMFRIVAANAGASSCSAFRPVCCGTDLLSVVGGGVEPPTAAFNALCSTRLSYPDGGPHSFRASAYATAAPRAPDGRMNPYRCDPFGTRSVLPPENRRQCVWRSPSRCAGCVGVSFANAGNETPPGGEPEGVRVASGDRGGPISRAEGQAWKRRPFGSRTNQDAHAPVPSRLAAGSG